MVEGSGYLAAVGALAAPRSINTRSKSLLRLPAPDEINVIDVGEHSCFPSRQIVRKMRDAERLRYQMNPPANKMNDSGAMFINCAGGYFRGWYIMDGVVNYLPEAFDTESRAQEAAEHARRSFINP